VLSVIANDLICFYLNCFNLHFRVYGKSVPQILTLTGCEVVFLSFSGCCSFSIIIISQALFCMIKFKIVVGPILNVSYLSEVSQL